MDRFAALSTFVAVADHGGFAKAARHLGMSPPAVTRVVGSLERHLGVSLFSRSTRSVLLTAEGSALLERARGILLQLQEVEHVAMGGQSTPYGELHVTAPVIFGRLHVLPVVTKLLAQHGPLTTRLLLVDRNIRLVEEGIDVAVRIGALPDSGLTAVAIGAVRQTIVASPAYLARRGQPARPQDLGSHEIIAGDSIRVGAQWQFASKLERVPVTPRLTVNSVDALLAAVTAGLGLANVLSYQVAEALAAGVLRSVLDEHAPPPVPVHLLFPASRAQMPSVRHFIEGMRERARSGAWS